ncbi:hypothetical protein HOK51_00960 [Candidatus Woesearchaeota archaeon]|nr:hypothetical protein [Candidatus Woesearchaeota archaeon]MBT6518385.1 hypothetical protein [Candidatus Woesearchaeota archaeon]MBT7366835.1 hypothetical protein [Candidatus Woesearchaeota archaeon]
MNLKILNKLMLTIIIAVVLLVIVGCGAKYVCSNGATVSDPDLCPKSKTVVKSVDSDVDMTDDKLNVDEEYSELEEKLEDEPVVVLSKKLSSDMNNLLEKHTKIKSYHYFKDSGTSKGYEVWVKGNKLKKRLSPDSYLPANRVDVVFIDRDKKTAYGYCYDTAAETDCIDERMGKAFKLSFTKENVETPLDILDSINYIEEIGEDMFQDRNTVIVQTDDNFKYWFDTYYGLIMKQQKLEETDDGFEVIEEHTFTDVYFNGLNSKEVSLPDEAVMG